MKLPLQITFHGVAHSDFLHEYIRKRAEKLDTFFDRIMSCRVAIESPHRHKKKGVPYRVRIELGVPQDEIVVSREMAEDAYAAIDAAFDDAQRRLLDHVRLQRGDTRRHERARHGVVAKLFSYEGYGFIRTEEGEDLYFHHNSVLNGGFAAMKIGSRVRFAEETGEDGLHATSIALLRARRKKAPTESDELAPKSRAS